MYLEKKWRVTSGEQWPKRWAEVRALQRGRGSFRRKSRAEREVLAALEMTESNREEAAGERRSTPGNSLPGSNSSMVFFSSVFRIVERI